MTRTQRRQDTAYPTRDGKQTLYTLILTARIAAKIRVSFLTLTLNCLKNYQNMYCHVIV